VLELAREDVEVYLHALQTMTKQVQLCAWEIYCFGRLLGTIWK
jgi:hypothetical protein